MEDCILNLKPLYKQARPDAVRAASEGFLLREHVALTAVVLKGSYHRSVEDPLQQSNAQERIGKQWLAMT